jgi:hypothetical protein
MEELQDAIEDAHYINAMQNSVPRPTKEWPVVSSDALVDFKERLLAENPNSLDAEWICNGSLGFYLVSSSVSRSCVMLWVMSVFSTSNT